jgi:hypothetical protein
VFCGRELTEYRAHIENATREGKEAGEKIEHESQEAETKAQRSEEEALRNDGSGAPPEESPG